jgi:hypothetical protein
MTTTFLIGVDEAGYGPNLGPLVVAATLWRVDDAEPSEPAAANGYASKPRDVSTIDLYRILADRVCLMGDKRRVAIADSKVLFSPAAGLSLLEEGVLAALRSCEMAASCWMRLVALLGADPDGNGQSLPWHDGWDTPLPVAACSQRIDGLAQRLASQNVGGRVRGLHRSKRARLCDVQACLVQPPAFNQLVAESGTKATALSRITLALVRRVLGRLASTHTGDNGNGGLSTFALCDKHGGRNFYAPLLAEAFSQPLIHTEQESRAISRYRVPLDGLDAVIAFKRDGETFLPTALASMTAKYVRELSMRAFNDFWCCRVSDLRPTAGYPGDSRRFKTAIAKAQRDLGIDDHVLWRSR